jgi:hypothetical protein
MSLPRLAPLAQPDPLLRLVIDFYAETHDFRVRARTWWRGINPWRLKPIRREGTVWYTIGCAYRWSLYIDILRDESAVADLYQAYQKQLAAWQEQRAYLAPHLNAARRAILDLAPSQTYHFDGHDYGHIPIVDAASASTAHTHVCCVCQSMIARPELQRPGQSPTWYCATCAEEPASMYEFTWRSVHL